MAPQWSPGTQYNLGDVVEYEQRQYKIIQPHFSQGDWTPPNTPALWGLVPAYDCGNDYTAPPSAPYPTAPSQDTWASQTVQQAPIQPDERKKHWYDMDDKRKKELEIGGGLALGLGLLGAGYAAYHHHEVKSEEDKKAFAWGAQNWLHDAQTRTECYFRDGPSGPTTWVLVHGTNIPQGAIEGGEAGGNKLYICRAFFESSVQVGKCASSFNKGAVIGYGHKEVELDTYEVLLGDASAVQWFEVSGRFSVNNLPGSPVEAGREADGSPLYVAQAPIHDGTHCGKVSEKLGYAYIAADGKEVEARTYRVLCYSS